MAETTADIRQLIRADRTQPDSAAVAHVLTGTIFLGVGAIAAALAVVSMSFPAFVPLGYGVWRAVMMLALVMGFATLGLIGATYFALPRLTGARLWNENLAWIGLVLIGGVTALGIVVVAAGLGDGREPFGLPWWLDLPLLAGLGIPPLVTVLTLRDRTEPRTFVTVPYAVTGLAALPLLYLGGNIPGLNPVASAVGDLFLTAAYITVLLLVGVGLGHYAVVKQTAQPLAGRQLSHIAFWSLLFGAGWFGVAQLLGGPIPPWLGTIAAVLGLGLPVGLVAGAAGFFSTIEGRWIEEDQVEPVAMFSVAGLCFGTVVAVLAALAGFRSAGHLVAFTSYWEGVVFGFVLGALPLLIGAVLIHVIPRMTGRSLFSRAQAGRAVRLIVFGAGGLVVFLVAAGLITGYSWAGGSFTGAFAAVGEGWDPAMGPSQGFILLAAIAGVVGAVGNLSLASLITRTLTRGTVTTQEVLVTVEEP